MDEHKKFPGIGIEISLQNPCRMCPHDHCGNCTERSKFTRTWEQAATESINNLQNELKTCPFCGEIPHVSCSGISMKFYIWCETDNCILRCLDGDNATEYSDMFDLIDAWNRRSDNVRRTNGRGCLNG